MSMPGMVSRSAGSPELVLVEEGVPPMARDAITRGRKTSGLDGGLDAPHRFLAEVLRVLVECVVGEISRKVRGVNHSSPIVTVSSNSWKP